MKLKQVLGFLAAGAWYWNDAVEGFRISTGQLSITTGSVLSGSDSSGGKTEMRVRAVQFMETA